MLKGLGLGTMALALALASKVQALALASKVQALALRDEALALTTSLLARGHIQYILALSLILISMDTWIHFQIRTGIPCHFGFVLNTRCSNRWWRTSFCPHAETF